MLILLASSSNPVDHVLPHPIDFFGVHINNHILMAMVAGILMLVIFPVVFRRASADTPTGARNFLEAILEFLRSEVFRPALKEHTERFLAFLWTLFFFILFCNLLGTIPFGAFFALFAGEKGQAIGGTATGNINTTAALAMCAFLFIHLSGMVEVGRSLMQGRYWRHGDEQGHGGGKKTSLPLAIGLAAPLYLWNFAPHPFKPQVGESKMGWLGDIPIWLMLLVLELVGACIKPVSLSIRLFANMIAGHIVLAVLVSLIPVTAGIIAQIGVGIPITGLSLMIRLLEIFVAFLQAYIFTFLVTLFIGSAVAPEH